MSIIQKLHGRNAAIFISVVIGLSLISFILMDAYIGKGRGNQVTSTTIGSVNGKNIEYDDFNERIKTMEEQYKSQGMNNLNENMRMNMRTQVWNQIQDETILQGEYENLGLQYTTKEMDDALFGANPPEWLKQPATDSASGLFDPAKAKQLFANIKKDKDKSRAEMVENQLLKPMIENGMRTKYASLLSGSAFMPKWLAEKQLTDDAQVASVSVMNASFASISDSAVKPTDADITDFLTRHKNEYKQAEETRSISYVMFNAQPNGKDSAIALTKVNDLKASFATSTDPENFLNVNNSSTPYYDQFLSKSAIQVPNKDSILKLGVGQTFGPYIENDNNGGAVYKIAKMIATKTIADSVKAKHILVAYANPQTRQPIRDSAAAQKRMDSIIGLMAKGQSFDTLAKQLSDDPGSGAKGGDLGFFPYGAMVPEFNDFCFSAGVGATKVVKTQFGLHYIQVTGVKEQVPHYKIAYFSKAIDASTETNNTAKSAADMFAGESRNPKLFDATATKKNYNKLIAGEIKASDFTIQGLGDSRQMVKWIYDASVGDISESFDVGGNYVVAIVTSIDKEGLPSAKKARSLVENFVRNEMKGKQILAKIGGAKTLEEMAKLGGGNIVKADSVRFAQPFVQGIGAEARLAGAAFNKALIGKVSEAFVGNSGVYALQVNNIGSLPSMSSVEDMRKSALISLKGAASYSFMEALKKVANIKDMRNKFF
jgi:peptidyl-prolyl cis-trans isomerase D